MYRLEVEHPLKISTSLSLPFPLKIELGTFLSLATLLFLQCYYLLKKYLYSKDLWFFLMPLIVWNYWWFIFFLILSFCFPGFGHMAEIITCQKFSVFVFTLIPLEWEVRDLYQSLPNVSVINIFSILHASNLYEMYLHHTFTSYSFFSAQVK